MDSLTTASSSTVSRWILASIALCACAAIGSVLNEQWGWFMLLKPLTTILVIGLFVWRSIGLSRRESPIALIALFACLLGDALLLKNDYFVFGLAAFFVAHLCFIVSFISLRGNQLKPKVLGISLLICGAYYSILYPKLGALLVPVAAYLLIIVIMMAQAIGMALNAKGHQGAAEWQIAIGALLFGVSDSVIALNKFLVPFDWSALVVLSLYWLAISLLAFALPTLIAQSKR
ncbi:lysoplasmalogenase [Arenicella xantha]|uniref:Putative membrane protein YhhN n=1 Tax=Arenicella xantha TaxID=644221 RepID=A0A395JSZ9_9GAMM|nr:lysoplasmalogenase [Arenicella xantha]RBP53596.1 putative membrane protein YhhN [Arenicella xantha]